MNDSVNDTVSGSLPSRAPADQGTREGNKGREWIGESDSPSTPPSSSSTRAPATVDGSTRPIEARRDVRPLDAIRADLEHPHTAALLAVRASVGDGPIGRLLRDVGPLVERLAAVERERDEAREHLAEALRAVEYFDAQSKRRLARIAAVEARAAFESSALNEPYRRGFNNAMAQIRAVLAASPTPTGPERCPECNHEPGCWCPETPTPHGCRTCLATPTEPTEETP